MGILTPNVSDTRLPLRVTLVGLNAVEVMRLVERLVHHWLVKGQIRPVIPVCARSVCVPGRGSVVKVHYFTSGLLFLDSY